MHRGENEASATAPTMPTRSQTLAPSTAEVAVPEKVVTEVRPTSDRPDFLLILLRSLSAWGT
jgi:hypothetical protein